MIHQIKVILPVVFIGLWPKLSSAQCAMCRAVLENESEGVAGEAINDGITFLVIWPYLLVLVAAFMVWRIAKSSNKNSNSNS